MYHPNAASAPSSVLGTRTGRLVRGSKPSEAWRDGTDGMGWDGMGRGGAGIEGQELGAVFVLRRRFAPSLVVAAVSVPLFLSPRVQSRRKETELNVENLSAACASDICIWSLLTLPRRQAFVCRSNRCIHPHLRDVVSEQTRQTRRRKPKRRWRGRVNFVSGKIVRQIPEEDDKAE